EDQNEGGLHSGPAAHDERKQVGDTAVKNQKTAGSHPFPGGEKTATARTLREGEQTVKATIKSRVLGCAIAATVAAAFAYTFVTQPRVNAQKDKKQQQNKSQPQKPQKQQQKDDRPTIKIDTPILTMLF